MGRRKKKLGCLGTLMVLPIIPFAIIFDSALHYKPTPIVGGDRRKKRKKDGREDSFLAVLF